MKVPTSIVSTREGPRRGHLHDYTNFATVQFKLCRKGAGPHYAAVSVLSPGKYLAQARGGLLGRGRGWRGDPASDIPASLFPKHVQVSCRPRPIKPFLEILILPLPGSSRFRQPGLC